MFWNKVKNSKTTIVAHDGPFHPDDVFAVATLRLLLDSSNKSREVEVIRTRDEKIIADADYVVDVGGVHDPEKNRFDHHQVGRAGERANTIPYAAFGLVWKKFGEQICGQSSGAAGANSETAAKVAEIIDQKLVQPIDAMDNGVSISEEIFEDVRPYDIRAVISAMAPSWNEDIEKTDSIFLKAVELAQGILAREIKLATDQIEGEKFVLDIYNKTEDKRIIVLDQIYPWGNLLSKFPEPLYVVYPRKDGWGIKAIRSDTGSFVCRKDLPASWAGKKDAELSAVTGVPGGIFCHNNLFMAAAKTKEVAVAMAKIAVEA